MGNIGIEGTALKDLVKQSIKRYQLSDNLILTSRLGLIEAISSESCFDPQFLKLIWFELHFGGLIQ